VGPPQIRRQEDDAGRRVERAWRADPDARDLLAARGAHRSAGELGDAIDHRVRPLLGDGRLRDEAQHLGPVLGNRSRDDVRAADVDPDYVAHVPPGLTPPPPPPLVRARRWPRSPPAPARHPHPACSGGGVTGTPMVRAGSTGGTAAPRARPPGRAGRAARSRTPARWSRRSRPSGWRPPGPGAAARCRSSRAPWTGGSLRRIAAARAAPKRFPHPPEAPPLPPPPPRSPSGSPPRHDHVSERPAPRPPDHNDRDARDEPLRQLRIVRP